MGSHNTTTGLKTEEDIALLAHSKEDIPKNENLSGMAKRKSKTGEVEMLKIWKDFSQIWKLI